MRGFVFAARWQIKRCHDPAGGTNQARPRSGKFASRKAGTRGQMPGPGGWPCYLSLRQGEDPKLPPLPEARGSVRLVDEDGAAQSKPARCSVCASRRGSVGMADR